MATRATYTSIESTADQAESQANQGRFDKAERYFRELVGAGGGAGPPEPTAAPLGRARA